VTRENSPSNVALIDQPLSRRAAGTKVALATSRLKQSESIASLFCRRVEGSR
jgi:hypothetical protein